ncbi:hypothetical protein Ddc_14388 [Ditylenchus destructor]|nr:hypothetical protein Ddc_14388 [Ditylenchus destructor]
MKCLIAFVLLSAITTLVAVSRRLDVIVQYEVYEVISDDQTGINTKKAYGTYINITGETIDVNQNSKGYHNDKEGVHGTASDGFSKRIEAVLKIYKNINPHRSFVAVHDNSDIYFLDHSGNEKEQCKADRTFLQCLQTAYQLNEKQNSVDNILSVRTGTEQNNVFNVPIMRIKVDKQKSGA